MWPRSRNRGERQTVKGQSYSLQPRFNVATVQEPWRTSENCGKSSHNRALQCGHGPGTVENGEVLGGSAGTMVGLQCGHGPGTVENLSILPWRLGRLPASMWPRSRNRGEP